MPKRRTMDKLCASRCPRAGSPSGREPGWTRKRFPHLCRGKHRSAGIQVACDSAVTISVEERRRGLEARRCGAWATGSKLTPNTPGSLKTYDACTILSGPGTLGAGQGNRGHEELCVWMVGLLDHEFDVTGLDH